MFIINVYYTKSNVVLGLLVEFENAGEPQDKQGGSL